MLVIVPWIVSAVIIAGAILNIRQNILCFYLWAIGNTAWLVFDLWSGLPSRAVLDVFQVAAAIWGIAEWRTNSEKG